MYRLENLSSSGSKKIELNIPNSSHSYAYRIGDICILNIDSGNAFVGKKANDILFKLPSNLYPKTRTIATLGSFLLRLSREIVVYIEPNGDCVLKTQDAVCQTAYYGNINYIIPKLNIKNSISYFYSICFCRFYTVFYKTKTCVVKAN